MSELLLCQGFHFGSCHRVRGEIQQWSNYRFHGSKGGVWEEDQEKKNKPPRKPQDKRNKSHSQAQATSAHRCHWWAFRPEGVLRAVDEVNWRGSQSRCPCLQNCHRMLKQRRPVFGVRAVGRQFLRGVRVRDRWSSSPCLGIANTNPRHGQKNVFHQASRNAKHQVPNMTLTYMSLAGLVTRRRVCWTIADSKRMPSRHHMLLCCLRGETQNVHPWEGCKTEQKAPARTIAVAWPSRWSKCWRRSFPTTRPTVFCWPATLWSVKLRFRHFWSPGIKSIHLRLRSSASRQGASCRLASKVVLISPVESFWVILLSGQALEMDFICCKCSSRPLRGCNTELKKSVFESQY